MKQYCRYCAFCFEADKKYVQSEKKKLEEKPKGEIHE